MKYLVSVLVYQALTLTALVLGCFLLHGLLYRILFFIGFTVVHSIIAFCVYGLDKKRAEKEQWRIPESVLHAICALYGVFGAIGGMMFFHHKTSKPSFYMVTLFTALCSLCLYTFTAFVIFSWLPEL